MPSTERRAAYGTLSYSTSAEGFKLVVEVEPDFGKLYRALIPRYLHPQPTRYPPHITVVRRETPPASWRWKHHDGRLMTFLYDPEVRFDATYFWLRCWSSLLTDIRLDLGLPEQTEYTRPPDGDDCFHCTVANRKHVR